MVKWPLDNNFSMSLFESNIAGSKDPTKATRLMKSDKIRTAWYLRMLAWQCDLFCSYSAGYLCVIHVKMAHAASWYFLSSVSGPYFKLLLIAFHIVWKDQALLFAASILFIVQILIEVLGYLYPQVKSMWFVSFWGRPSWSLKYYFRSHC